MKIITKLVKSIPEPDFPEQKLGVGDRLVQVDETMLNHECKSHRGRSAQNRTDSISIIEIENGIRRVYAQIIPNKKAETLIPKICRHVCYGAKIHTDEHRSYSGLSNLGFGHGIVCHKFEFVNRLMEVNTQAVESFHSIIDYWIKSRKGVQTNLRSVFLKEFCFFMNNKSEYLQAILNLMRIN